MQFFFCNALYREAFIDWINKGFSVNCITEKKSYPKSDGKKPKIH